MASQGNPPQGAPNRTLVQLLLDRPFTDGSGVLSAWAGQFLQRLVDYVGPVSSGAGGGGGSGGNQTITQQIENISNQLGALAGGQGADGPTQARLLALEGAPMPLAAFPAAPASELPEIPSGDLLANISGALALPIGTKPSAFLDSAFGTITGTIIVRNPNISAAPGWQGLRPGMLGQTLVTRGTTGAPFWGTSGAVLVDGAGHFLDDGTGNEIEVGY